MNTSQLRMQVIGCMPVQERMDGVWEGGKGSEWGTQGLPQASLRRGWWCQGQIERLWLGL